MLHVQTNQKEAPKMVEEAKLLKEELKGGFYMKIPIGEEGLKVAMEIGGVWRAGYSRFWKIRGEKVDFPYPPD